MPLLSQCVNVANYQPAVALSIQSSQVSAIYDGYRDPVGLAWNLKWFETPFSTP